MDSTADTLETFYRALNRRAFVHPDPIEFLYPFRDIRDRELVAFIAASLAYGRVEQILKSVRRVLEKISSPACFIQSASRKTIQRSFSNFKHRFTTGEELIAVICGLQRILRKYGSLETCFAEGVARGAETVLPGLSIFAEKLIRASEGRAGSLVPEPRKGSACKRLHLFLRWVVRRDAVDPGGWKAVTASQLIVPVDTHMHRIGRTLGFTGRGQADQRTALEITRGFREFSRPRPHKPETGWIGMIHHPGQGIKGKGAQKWP
jgi:uncharacterized protein (TIGR02757 family)